jgi:serine/threonine protein phosphatase PrpC
LNPQEIIDIVSGIKDPAAAAEELAKRAAVLWATNNDYCDDISAVVIFIDGDGPHESSFNVPPVNGADGSDEKVWF